MAQQYNFSYYPAPPAQAQAIPRTYNNMGYSSGRPRLDIDGGEPMEATGSNQSAYSNISHSSSLLPASSPNTAYGSYESNVFPTSFNNNGIAGSNYAETDLEVEYQQLSLDGGSYLPASSSRPPRHTPSSLEWTPETTLAELYKFCMKKGHQPYLELLPKWKETLETPRIVYLDEPGFDQPKGTFPCMFPGICVRKNGEQSTFNRPADLDRHYRNVHSGDESKQKFYCSHPRCQRAKGPFTRKDHYRDHLRDYHKDDLGHAKKPKDGSMTDREWEAAQSKWLTERVISPKHWRCARCLCKIYVAEHGWDCPTCKMPCEQDRVDVRMRMLSDGPSQLQPFIPYSSCDVCSGSGYITDEYSQWGTCWSCQPPSESPYDTNHNGGFQMDIGYNSLV